MAARKASCNCGKLSVAYDGPDPERISLCQCYECQKRTGTVLSVQTRIPREQVTIEGQSTTWTFPSEGAEPVTFRSCDSGRATYHFCPERFDRVLGYLRRPGRDRGRSRRLHRPDVSAADDFRLRSVRASVGYEPLGPFDPALRLRRNIARRATSVTTRPVEPPARERATSQDSSRRDTP